MSAGGPPTNPPKTELIVGRHVSGMDFLSTGPTGASCHDGSSVGMAQVSLIFPTTSRTLFSPERALPYQRSLQEAGHAVEVIVVNGSGAIKHVDFEPSWRRVEAREPGLAEAAITGLRAARGDVLLLLDTAMGYLPADLNRVAEALVDGAADLAVASQFAGKSP